MVGSTLSHYRIVGELGRGGMGEVFLARDTTLDRNVALKFLPIALSDDPERLARFEREAKLLASLNHPNVAAVHGFVDRVALFAEDVADHHAHERGVVDDEDRPRHRNRPPRRP
jgi:serine/threonine protein kinase